MISKEDWIGRRLVADRFQNGRVFICGDAAHLWIPHAGYGMNAGIADADNLGWMLAAVLNGWAEPAMLDAYQAERQPITDQVSKFAFKMSPGQFQAAPRNSRGNRAGHPAGEAARAAIGKQARDLYIQQQCCGGLNFGYFYEGSPIIAYDGAPHPDYSMGQFTSSRFRAAGRRIFGCATATRSTTRWDRTSDCCGSIRPWRWMVWSPRRRSAAFRSRPRHRGCREPHLYARKLVLVRPDRHVAWRADAEPDDPLELIDHLRGARIASDVLAVSPSTP